MNGTALNRCLWAIAITAFCLSCNKPSHPLPTDGRIVNRVYTNDYFAFAFKFPEGWITDTKVVESMDRKTAAKMKESALAEDSDQAAVMAYLADKTHVLLVLTTASDGKSPRTSVIAFNSMPCSHGSSRLSAAQIISSNDAGLISRDPPCVRIGQIDSVQIGGREFSHAAYHKPAHGLMFRQDYYVTVSGNYCLLIIPTALNEDDMSSLQNYLSSLKFAAH